MRFAALLFFLATAHAQIELTDIVVKTDVPEGQNVAEQRALNGRLNTNASVMATGGFGSTTMNTPVFIRGMDSKHTAVTLDGVLLKDPAATDSRANFSVLGGMQQGQISIQPGAQGALNNSQSVAGLISVETVDELRPYVFLGHGLEKEVGFGIQAGHGLTRLLISGSMAESSELAQSHARGGDEIDPYQFQNLDLKLLHAYSDTTASETYVKRYQNRMDLDPAPYTDGEEDGSGLRMNLINHKTGWALESGGTLWHRISWHSFEREQFSAFKTFDFNATSGQNQITWQNVDESWKVDWYYDQDKFETDTIDEKTASISDANFTRTFVHGPWRTTVRAGVISHTEFNQRGTLLLGLSKQITPSVELGASAASTFSPPSLYHLYGPDVVDGFACASGNTDLLPEKGVNQEAWLVQKYGSGEWSARLYQQNISDVITHNCQDGYQNEEELKATGHELSWKQGIGKSSLGASYGKFDFKLSSDEQLLRRPEQKFSLFGEQRLSDAHSLVAVYTWIGALYDKYDDELVQLGEKGLVDLGWNYSHGNTAVKALVSNAANEEDSFVYGFSGKRRVVQVRLFYYY